MNENEEKLELIRAMTALDIRQSAMRSLELYHDRIARHMSKRSLLPSDRDVKKRLAELLDERSEDRADESLVSLTEYSGDCVRPFVEQLNEINRVYNTPMTLLFDRGTLYLSSAT